MNINISNLPKDSAIMCVCVLKSQNDNTECFFHFNLSLHLIRVIVVTSPILKINIAVVFVNEINNRFSWVEGWWCNQMKCLISSIIT